MQRLPCYHLRQVHTSINIDKTMKSDLLGESWLLCHPRAHGPSTPMHTGPRAHGLQHPRAHRLYRAATSTPRLRLLQHLWHLRQVTSRHLRLRMYGIFANKHLKTTLKRRSPSSSPRLPRATTTSTSTMQFPSMGLKNPRSTSSGSV